MNFWRRDARRFSTAESFRLFIEGVRNLQLYEDEASKGDDGATSEFPDQRTLKQSLQEAYQNLNQCAVEYPDDLLPYYYRGIVSSLKAQESQALELLGSISQPYHRPSDDASDKFLDNAAKDFQRVVDHATGEMKLYAQYNRAQALARLHNPADWDEARRTLSGMKLGSPDLESVPKWKRIACRAVLLLGDEEEIVSKFAGRLFRQVDGEQGVLASVARAKAEQTALILQVELLKSFIVARYSSYMLSLDENPSAKSAGVPTDDELQIAVGQLKGFLDKLRDSGIPEETVDDIEADYWNKTSFLYWEQSSNQPNAHNRGEILRQAERCARQALDLKGRKNWTPAQLNLARVLSAQGKTEDSSKILKKILGAEIVQGAEPKRSKQGPDPVVISDVIMKMAPANNARAITQSIEFAWGKLDRSVVQNVLSSLAGRIDPGLLSQIVGQL